MLVLKKVLYKYYRISVIIFCLIGAVYLADSLSPLDLRRYHDLSHIVLDAEGDLLTVFLAQDQRWRLPIHLEEVDPLFLRMLIAYEDKRFFYHPGIDPFALSRALWQWIKTKRILSGGSTLTLQTVRLLEPRPRTVLSKLKEFLRALQLECHFSKREILEIYLSLAPYGGNLEGIRAASLSYFDKEPKRLTTAEAALLVALPQQPERLKPDYYAKQARLHRDKILRRMHALGLLNKNQAIEGLQDNVPTLRHRFPRTAVHLAYRLISREPNQTIHSTFINAFLQKQVEALLFNQLQFLELTQTVSALVLDNKTQRVIAYVGSGDFYSEERCGQIDMIMAIRSPGSTLKPFIYAMGFDDKIIHPDTLIEDVPTRFKDYAPGNFRDCFHGTISIREALQQSLNIPAVMILDKIGPGRFASHLTRLGIALRLEQSSSPSLPIALGGIGTCLFDLTALYCALANKGEFSALVLSSTQTMVHSKQRLSSASSAAYIQHILEETPVPSGLVDYRATHHRPLAYKTGTSYGSRDAWAIGFTPEFTVGVWLGKADGTPSGNQTGRTHAAPILFRIFDFLPRQSQPTPAIAPSALPSALSHFNHSNNTNENKSSKFQILFPKDNTTLQVETKDTGWRSIPIKVSGGKPPFYCLENGRPIFNFQERETRWHPSSMGFSELTILDSAGKSVSITIQLQAD